MKKVREIIRDKKFYLCIIISILFFGVFCKIEYTTDTYTVFQRSFKEIFMHFITSGRFITAGGYALTKILHMKDSMIYILSFLFAILCTSISIYKLDEIFKKDIESKVISIIATILVVINIFSIELYLFIEKGILMLSVLFCVLAIQNMIKYFEGNKKSIIYVFIYMLLANFSYQGTVGIFVSVTLVYIIKYSKNNIKNFAKNTVATALCYGIPALINYALVRFAFTNNRVSGASNLIESLQKIINESKNMIFTTFEIMPKYLFGCLIIVVTLLIIYNVIKNSKGNKAWLIFGLIFVIIGNFAVTILPQIMQSTASIWLVPRNTYTYAALIGILLLYLFMNTHVNIKVEKTLTVIFIIYLSMQYISFQNIAKDRYILNYMDNYMAMQIGEMIQHYETDTKNTITQVAFYANEDSKYSYPKLYVNRDTNIKALYTEWTRLDATNYYLDRRLELVEENEEIYNNYFKNKKWNYFDKEQIVLENNTIHICIY